MCLYAGVSAYAQMATTTEAGNDGTPRLISNDERKIHFGSVAKKLYADLNPDTHAQNGGLDMSVHLSGDFGGYHDGDDNLQNATCTYNYDNGVQSSGASSVTTTDPQATSSYLYLEYTGNRTYYTLVYGNTKVLNNRHYDYDIDWENL